MTARPPLLVPRWKHDRLRADVLHAQEAGDIDSGTDAGVWLDEQARLMGFSGFAFYEDGPA